jgi:hypothetical protein
MAFSSRFYRQIVAALMLALVTMSCTWSLIDLGQFTNPQTPVPGGGNAATATPVALAEVNINLSLPVPLAPGESLYLALLDEVTGLGLNPLMYQMQPVDAQKYTVKLPIQVGSVIKYRYIRQGNVSIQEYTGQGAPVRYRVAYVPGPTTVDDILTTWGNQNFAGPSGSIAGVVTNGQTGQPIPNIMVAAGGLTTLTDSLGQFALIGLPLGTHNLSAFALDGAFKPFQQGAAIAPGLTTNAPLVLQPAPLVQVTFNVALPSDTVKGAPVRLAGNVLQLGNTFADLAGGVSAVSGRMPSLSAASVGRQSITLKLPAGADIRYKYTLGDGFWNAEHDSAGKFVVRQIIVPAQDTVINDTVATWQSGNSAPILFEVSVPQNTPASDVVSIQFNPYAWTEAIPMWPLGNNKWVYKLFSPLDMVTTFGYRYCRNEQCGSADDISTLNAARTVSTAITAQDLKDIVSGWNWWPESEPSTIITVPVNARPGGFWSGVELQAAYHPTWQPQMPYAAQNIQGLGANMLVITPTWTASLPNPGLLVFAPTPGIDPLWADSIQTVQDARSYALNVAIYAVPRLQPSNADFWLSATRSPEWWNTWFERYRAFALYHADLATQSGAQALVLGGEAILPALPGGMLVNGTPSNVPGDAETRWRNLIGEVRGRFKGQVLWALPYESALPPAPVFIDMFDAVYLLWSAPLAAGGNTSVDAMTAEAGRRMDNDLIPYLAKTGKNVVIAVNYPSASGAANGCVSSGAGGCYDWAALARPYPDIPAVVLDLKLQADLYQSMLQAVNARSWISGFVSRGYYPPAALMDKSSSVRGKPAADLLWYWLPRFTGAAR